MPTIVYLVPGMGCGTADGKPRAAADQWSAPVIEAVNWIVDTYKLQKPMVLDPIPTKPPKGSDDPNAVWVVPISYHKVFDEFRASSADRQKLVKGLNVADLTDAHITKLAESEFAWTRILDVVLWWGDTIQTRARATGLILGAIAQANELAGQIPQAKIRRILVSHSLGTAASTYALRNMGTKPVWPAIGGFEYWATLANVSPLLLPTADVYSPPLIVGQAGGVVGTMSVVHHEADPMPWILPWRGWSPDHAGTQWQPTWAKQRTDKMLTMHETRGVAAPTGREPEVSDVHGFANYLMSSQASLELAAAIRGGDFHPTEIQDMNPDAKWAALPRLTSAKAAAALSDLKAKRDAFMVDIPVPADPINSTDGWLGRLLRAADLVMAATEAGK